MVAASNSANTSTTKLSGAYGAGCVDSWDSMGTRPFAMSAGIWNYRPLLYCSIAQFKMRETGCAANSVSREPQSAEHVRLVKNRSPCWPSGHVPDCLSRNQKSCVAYRTHSSGSKYLSSLELGGS